jgi:RNA 3'-terminal phosphate cyclase (ATP)
MIVIDGSVGEGGGQILRTSLSLSLVTGKPFRIEKIRAGRKMPGLLRQHLTAVTAAATIGRADVTGAAIGSSLLEFAPRSVEPGEHTFVVGTAGSTTLVLQTVLPALLTARLPSKLVLEGGTHNPFAPPFDFLARSFLPLICRMGPVVEARLVRPGFYPAGGGEIRVAVRPSTKLRRLDLESRGRVISKRARAIVSKLPLTIASRELRVVGRALSWSEDHLFEESVVDPSGPGNVVLIEIECENVTEVFTAFGQKGVRAEAVAEAAARQARRYLESETAVGEHLADQLIVPMALADGGSFTTLPLSQHATTNITVVGKFLDIRIDTLQLDGGLVSVTIGSAHAP